MPVLSRPNNARGAKSRANLKRTAGPGRPKRTTEEKAREKEAQRTALRLLTDPKYVRGLRDRLNSGKCQPGVEVAVWHYAYGKPKDVLETKTPPSITIRHSYEE